MFQFSAWKCLNYGIFGEIEIETSLRVVGAQLADNKVGVLVNVVGPSSVSHIRADKKVEISDALIVGRSGEGGDNSCDPSAQVSAATCAGADAHCKNVFISGEQFMIES